MYAERGFNDKNQPRVIATALLEIGERQPQSSPRRSQRQSRQPLNAKNGAVVLTGSPAEDGHAALYVRAAAWPKFTGRGFIGPTRDS